MKERECGRDKEKIELPPWFSVLKLPEIFLNLNFYRKQKG